MAGDTKAPAAKTGTLLERVLEISHQSVDHCYNCGKCTAGCPVAYAMDIPPQQMMRMVQLDEKERALKANTIWVCASCETCSARCPMEVQVAEVMDALRRMAVEEDYPVPSDAKAMRVFHNEFLSGIKMMGRLNEHVLLGMYKLKTGKFVDDIGLGIRLFGKNKIRPWHFAKIKNTGDMAKLFEAALSAGEDDDH